MSATRLSRFVGYGVIVAMITAAAVALAYYIKDNSNKTQSDDVIEPNVCYVAPSCENINPKKLYDPVTGFTNNTGFRTNNINDNSCCNICPIGVNQTVCFDVGGDLSAYRGLWGMESSTGYSAVDKNCSEKTGHSDYDFITLDQMYFPQLCNGLKEGHDFTLTHLAGTECVENITRAAPAMNIHGFWPNYHHGFPQCCDTNFTKTDDPASVTPLDPYSVQYTWQQYPLLQQNWFDPTTIAQNSRGINCATCSLLNHEWEKHGSCFSPSEPELYFAGGLEIHLYLTNHTRSVVAMNGSVVPTANISALYSHYVNVQCDPQATVTPAQLPLALASQAAPLSEVGFFSELQTCWKVVINPVSAEDVLSLRAVRRDADVTIAYSKRSGRVLARGVQELLDLLSGLTETQRRAPQYSLMELADFYWIDCVPSSPSQFSTPCPSKTYLATYNV